MATKIKIALLLCLLVVLTGCRTIFSSVTTIRPLSSRTVPPTFAIKVSCNIQVVYSGGVSIATINDTGYQPEAIACVGRAACPNSTHAHPNGDEIALVPGWKLDVQDDKTNPPTVVATITSPNASPYALVKADYYGRLITSGPDSETKGIRVAQADWKFTSALLTKRDGSTS